ncbi:uncharacterized protein [Parasteatoda tepidariorum]|uniref:uncharacterized protein n=1 Tax=Parasteatoda tepidariorum TaxID=114398 RepID=UPI00077FE46D|nr:uncharacterized protein LOC107449734 [Parasteatoda tepidariorum]
MTLMKVSAVLLLTFASCYATYNNGYHGGDGYHGDSNGGSRKVHIESPKIHLDGPKIHLDSAKILLDRPSIHVKNSAQAHELLGDDEPIILENDKPLYIRKSLHGFQPSASAILIEGNHGHGGYGSSHGGYGSSHGGYGSSHGGYGSSHGGYSSGHGHASGYSSAKIVRAPATIVAAAAPLIAPAPIAHDAIFVRRPVHVAKELVPTQDHLEKAHFERVIVSGGYAHGHAGHPTGTVVHAVPISKAIQEKTVVYERAPLHSAGHGIISYSAYHSPSPVAVGPAVIADAGHGYGSHGYGLSGGKDVHHGYGGYKKY